MSWGGRWLLVGIAFLLFLAGCSRQPPLPHLAPDAVILAFGDSLTYGTGAGVGESYPVRLEQLLHRPVVNSGVPGETTAEGLQRLPRVLDEVRPQLLVLCLGGNDFLRHLDAAETQGNLRRMILLARRHDVPVVLIGVPRLGLLLKTAPMYSALAKEMNIPLVDDVLEEVLSDPGSKSDYIHPNAKGYDVLAQAIAQVLYDAGAVRKAQGNK